MDLILEWYRSKKLTTSAAVEFAEFVATRWWWPFGGGLRYSLVAESSVRSLGLPIERRVRVIINQYYLLIKHSRLVN